MSDNTSPLMSQYRDIKKNYPDSVLLLRVGDFYETFYKDAICEQTEDPALAKGLVKRDVVEVLTPGTALNAQLVADPDNNYCAAVHANGSGNVAVALIDVGTGECISGEAPAGSFLHLIQGKRVRELV